MSKIKIVSIIVLISFHILSAQTTITGKLLGHDGRPMIVANVVLSKPLVQTPVETVIVGKTGAYNITVDSAGVWILTFAGVDHSSHQVGLYLDKQETLRLDVRLKTIDYVDSLKKVWIKGSFNNFNAQNPIPMQKEGDGTYVAEIGTKADSVAYELVGITKDGHTINGTQSERNVYDGGGDYWSVLTPMQGKVKVIFDPTKLARSDEPVRVTFADTQFVEAKFAPIFDEIMHDQIEFHNAYYDYIKSGGDLNEFRYDWSKETESIVQRLEIEKIPILRQELYMAYLSIGMLSAKMDSVIVRKSLTEISPASPVWSLDPTAITFALFNSGMSPGEQDHYVDRVLDENRSDDVKSQLLYAEFTEAKKENDTTKASAYYDQLVNKYGNTLSGRMVQAFFPRHVRVIIGNPVPTFSIASLEDSTVIYSNESLKGKYYMIDFWATWCQPCVNEMETLHDAYARYKNKGFTILSISLDKSRDDVIDFRKGKWKMPWLHAFSENGWNGKIVREFEVTSIPNPILADPAGRIVATGMRLRGELLENTLEKFLGK